MAQRSLSKREKLDRKLRQVASSYEFELRHEVLNILRKFASYDVGSIYLKGDQVPIKTFVELHDKEFRLALNQGHKLTMDDLREFLLEIEVESSGRSTKGGPSIVDHLFGEGDHHQARYGVWPEVRERRNELGR